MMSQQDYIRTMVWFRENHTDFIQESPDGFPAHFLCFDGSYFLLSTIEDCADFDEVRDLVLGAVAA